MIKPAYSVSFLLSINIFVWQNVLYFLDAPRTNTHTLGIRNTYCSSTTTMVARTHLNVTLYVHTSPVLTCVTLPCLDILLHSLRSDQLVSYSHFELPRHSSNPPSTCVFSLPSQFTSHDHHAIRIHVTQKAVPVLSPTYHTINM